MTMGCDVKIILTLFVIVLFLATVFAIVRYDREYVAPRKRIPPSGTARELIRSKDRFLRSVKNCALVDKDFPPSAPMPSDIMSTDDGYFISCWQEGYAPSEAWAKYKKDKPWLLCGW